MGFGDSIKKAIGIEEDYEDEITEEEIERQRDEFDSMDDTSFRMSSSSADMESGKTIARPGTERRFTVGGKNSDFKLLLIEPKTFEECPKLVDSLKAKRPVIINLERLETETARKIFDFLSGATYALNGNMQKVTNNIFIFAPENVDIAGGRQDETSNFDFGDNDDMDNDSPWR